MSCDQGARPLYGLDVRCVRLTPYKVDQRLLLDVQQVIPLPEARQLTVQLRRWQTQARAASTDSRDWTPYEIVTPAGRTEPLRKRRAVLALVTALHQAGLAAADLATVIPRSRFLPVDGNLAGEQLADAFTSAYPGSNKRLGGWFIEAPLHDNGRTWVLSKMWGTNTEPVLDRLLTLAPADGYSYEAASDS